jgi:hypothetical protein
VTTSLRSPTTERRSSTRRSTVSRRRTIPFDVAPGDARLTHPAAF